AGRGDRVQVAGAGEDDLLVVDRGKAQQARLAVAGGGGGTKGSPRPQEGRQGQQRGSADDELGHAFLLMSVGSIQDEGRQKPCPGARDETDGKRDAVPVRRVQSRRSGWGRVLSAGRRASSGCVFSLSLRR